MKLCAITMVYRDHWALAQWYRHFAAQLGAENLFIVAHGADDAIAGICPGASVITIPRDSLRGFDRVRNRMLNSFGAALGESFDWVIRTDADELICHDPNRHASLHDALAGCGSKAPFALGMNVFGDAPSAVFSGHYSKAFATRDGAQLMRHGVQVLPRRLHKAPFEVLRGVYLVHLKYANQKALIDANTHRMQIAAGDERGLPGAAWRKADKRSEAFFQRAETLEGKPWAEAEAEAYTQVSSNPVRDAEQRVVRAKSIDFKFRTDLPDWFGI